MSNSANLVDDVARDTYAHITQINSNLIKNTLDFWSKILEMLRNKRDPDALEISEYIEQGGKVAQFTCDNSVRNELIYFLKEEDVSFIRYDTTIGSRDVTGFLVKEKDIDKVYEIRDRIHEARECTLDEDPEIFIQGLKDKENDIFQIHNLSDKDIEMIHEIRRNGIGDRSYGYPKGKSLNIQYIRDEKNLNTVCVRGDDIRNVTGLLEIIAKEQFRLHGINHRKQNDILVYDVNLQNKIQKIARASLDKPVYLVSAIKKNRHYLEITNEGVKHYRRHPIKKTLEEIESIKKSSPDYEYKLMRLCQDIPKAVLLSKNEFDMKERGEDVATLSRPGLNKNEFEREERQRKLVEQVHKTTLKKLKQRPDYIKLQSNPEKMAKTYVYEFGQIVRNMQSQAFEAVYGKDREYKELLKLKEEMSLGEISWLAYPVRHFETITEGMETRTLTRTDFERAPEADRTDSGFNGDKDKDGFDDKPPVNDKPETETKETTEELPFDDEEDYEFNR